MTNPRALDAFLRDVYSYWSSGGLFALASLAWGRVLMLVCVGLVPLALASIDFHELSTCRARGPCPTSASAYWRHPTATTVQVFALAFFCATLPIAAALAWAAVGAVRRGLTLQCLIREWACVPDEELALRGWDGLLRALGDAAAAEADGCADSFVGFHSNAPGCGAREECASLLRQHRASALRRLPADVQAVVAQLARSVPERGAAPSVTMFRTGVLPRDATASSQAPLAVPPPPVTDAAASSRLGLPFASLTGAASMGAGVTGFGQAPNLVGGRRNAGASSRAVAPPKPSAAPTLADSTWLPLPSTAAAAGQPQAVDSSDPGVPPPLPPQARLLRPRDVAARVLRLEAYLAALACAGELRDVAAIHVPSPAPVLAAVARLLGTAACCGRRRLLWSGAWGGSSSGPNDGGPSPDEATRLLLSPPPLPAPGAPPAPPLPAPPPLVVRLPFTLSLQWALQALVLTPLVSSRGTLRPAALSPAGVRTLQARCRMAGALGLVAMPVTLPLAVLWVGLRQAEDALAARDYFGPRTWAPLAALLFAEHGELPHVVAARLAAAREPAQRFLDAFPSPAASALGRGAAFVAAALLALLATVGAADEDALLFVTLGGRSLWFYAAVLGGVLAAARAATQPAAPAPPGTPAAPLGRLADLSAALRFTPHAWGAGSAAWLIAARDEVAGLFLPRVAILAAEALGALTTPLALLTAVPARVPAIVEFVRHNTVHEPGVGAVCAPTAAGVAVGEGEYAAGGPMLTPDLASFLRRGPGGGDGDFGGGGSEAVALSQQQQQRDRLARSLASLVEQHPCEAAAAAEVTIGAVQSPAAAAAVAREAYRAPHRVRPVPRPAAGSSTLGGSHVQALLSRIPALEEEEEGEGDAAEEGAAGSGGGSGSGSDLDAVGAAMEAAAQGGRAMGAWGGEDVRASSGASLVRGSEQWLHQPPQPSGASLLPPGYEDLAEEQRLRAGAGRTAAVDLALLVDAGGAAAHL